jgi:hypothetical protein
LSDHSEQRSAAERRRADQFGVDRHPGFINLSAADSVKAAALAEQVRLEFRRGEWNAGRPTASGEFDVEQSRIGWRAGR